MRVINETVYNNHEIKVATIINKADLMIRNLKEVIEIKAKYNRPIEH